MGSDKSLDHEVESHPGGGVSEKDWTGEEEKKVVRKIDIYLLPMLWLMNLLSWMDRAK